MTTTRAIFTPFSAEFPSSNYPQLLLSNLRPVLAFDAATSEACYWTFVAPQGVTTPLTAVITYCMASATSGAVYFRGYIEAITAADATDTDATTSFDSANSGNGTVPATAGYIQQISITLTNNDSITAGDYVRFQLDRDAANASDTATGDAYVYSVEIRDAA